MLQTILSSIAASCGLTIQQYERVPGGDINESYCLHTTAGPYFLKLNDANRFPGMFEKEADGLMALRANFILIVPQVVNHGIVQDRQWLLLEWLKQASPKKNSQQNFGAALADMHLETKSYFGWHSNNYMGSLEQVNTNHLNWNDFYTQCRIMPLVEKLFNKGVFSKADIDNASFFCSHAGQLFPDEPPALLHGDLWSGNYMVADAGKTAIFDPAVYYGHREMDLGMTKLFGGFSEAFYDAYGEVYPLEENWEQRLGLTQLYPLLVHAVLFGEQYVESARQIIQKSRH